MANFYFTYGSEGHPFYGGWTMVDAPNDRAAIAAFRAYHPDKSVGLLNCCNVYDETQFKATEMFANGNRGVRCHELIAVKRVLAANA